MRYLFISCLLAITPFFSSAQTFQEVQKVISPNIQNGGEFGFGSTISGDCIAIGAWFENSGQGIVYVYERLQNGAWKNSQILSASDANSDESFGGWIDISGNYMVITSWLADTDESNLNPLINAGAAYIFKRDSISNSWIEEQKIVPSDRAAGDYFGYSASIDGDYVVIGAYGDDNLSGGNPLTDAGAAYIFKRNMQGIWTEEQKILSSDRENNDFFGFGVAISGNAIVSSAVFEDPNNITDAGAAYIFDKDINGQWNQIAKIVASDRSNGDRFGEWVDIQNNYLVVVANSEDEDENGMNTLNDAGAAYIFERDVNNNWGQVSKYVASDRAAGDNINRVAISNEKAVIGANQQWTNPSSNGKAYVIERNLNGTWVETQILSASDGSIDDWFGRSVAMSSSYIVVGARRDNEDVCGDYYSENSGSAYIFEMTTICSTTPTNLTTSNYKIAGNKSKATLSWERNQGAYTYQIQGGIQGGNPNNLITLNIPCGTSVYEATGIGEGQCYEWRIRSMCHDSTWSPWSPFSPFCVPACPDLNNIQTNINGNTVTFSWDVSEYAVGYVFQATTNPGNYNSPFEQILTPKTANSTTIGPIPPGNYKWRVRNGCSASPLSLSPFSTDQFFTVSSPITKAESEFDFTIFPNPANDKITIQIIGDFAYEVYDINGRKILQGNENRINASDLPEGLYNVVVRQGESVSTKRLVIAR